MVGYARAPCFVGTVGRRAASGRAAETRWVCAVGCARGKAGAARSRSRAARVVLRAGARGAGAEGEELVLTQENVERALGDAKETLGTLFGNSEQNRGVGITGDVELADLDGPTVVLRLRGRFWHKRADVLARVANYLQKRIPEIFEVSIEDEKQLDDSERNALQ